jgi:hypothetical protein
MKCVQVRTCSTGTGMCIHYKVSTWSDGDGGLLCSVEIPHHTKIFARSRQRRLGNPRV